MSLQDLRDYITQHIEELESQLDAQDGHDAIVDYLEGAIDAYQHVLGKLD